MTLFIAVAAALIAAVLAVLLSPLLRPPGEASQHATLQAVNARVYAEQLAELDTELAAGALSREQCSEARAELERRALEEDSAASRTEAPARAPRAALVLGVALPLAAAAMYAWLGTPAALAPSAQEQTAAPQVTPAQINAMVVRLQAKMEANPQDTAGWIMLGRSYAVLGRFREAADSYAKAADQRPDDAALLADYADVLAMANNRQLAGAPEQVIRRALKADPNNMKALVLAGTAAFERKAYGEAVKHWQQAIGQLPKDSEITQSLQSGIEEAKKRQQPKAK